MSRPLASGYPALIVIALVVQTSCSSADLVCDSSRRDVVERRVFTVTGKMPAEEDVEHLIETGESETIFQKAILEQGRGQVRCLTRRRRSHAHPLNCILA